jgi:hypothetical protein
MIEVTAAALAIHPMWHEMSTDHLAVLADSAAKTRSKIAAMAWPPPMHMVAGAQRSPVLLSSCSDRTLQLRNRAVTGPYVPGTTAQGPHHPGHGDLDRPGTDCNGEVTNGRPSVTPASNPREVMDKDTELTGGLALGRDEGPRVPAPGSLSFRDVAAQPTEGTIRRPRKNCHHRPVRKDRRFFPLNGRGAGSGLDARLLWSPLAKGLGPSGRCPSGLCAPVRGAEAQIGGRHERDPRYRPRP